MLKKILYNGKMVKVDGKALQVEKDAILETKKFTVSTNGAVSITPSSGYDGIGEVDLTVNVPTGQTGSLTITRNGTYNVTGFASVIVNVEGGQTEPDEPSDGKLPETYQEVEYVKGDGASYVDIDYIPTNATGCALSFSFNHSISDELFIGTRVTTTNRFAIGASFKSGVGIAIYSGWQFESDAKIRPVISNNVEHTFKLNYMNNRTRILDDVEATNTNMDVAIAPTLSLAMFGMRTSESEVGYYSKIAIYGLELTEGANVVANLVPCYEKATGTIGFYDIIRRQFYTNGGTGTLEKGADVN